MGLLANVDISSGEIGTICAVVAVTISFVVAWNSWLKDRDKRRERIRDETEEEYDTLRDQLDHFMLVMLGRPADRKLGIPAVRGFVDEQRDHNSKLDSDVVALQDEVKGIKRIVVNGGER